MRTKLTGADFCAMILGASQAIALEKEQINDLNVFPVPDGDTGTNMTLTMGAGAAEIAKKSPETIGAAVEVNASALLRGARGNSGVILSLLFRGLSKHLKDAKEADAKSFAHAMTEGVEAAYKAVMKPAEGTILTVSRVASKAAVDCAAKEADIEKVLEHTIKIGYEALARTIDQNPVLKKAGVVDAGGKGYLIILGGMLAALRGEEIVASGETVSRPAQVDMADFSQFDEEINFDYCTEFIVARENEKDPNALRNFLEPLGDSLVLIDDDELIKVHIHTDEPLRALTEAFSYGRLLNVKIENMRDQMEEMAAKADDTPQIAPAEKPFGFVAVSAGEGLTAVFSDLGVDCIVTGGQTMNPSTEEILQAIHSVPAETVFVLPNNKNIILAAQQTIDLAEKKVEIIPTKTIPQGVSALLCVDPSSSIEKTRDDMTEAYKNVRTAQITFAARDSDFDGHHITAGQYLALNDAGLLGASDDFDSIFTQTIHSFQAHDPQFIMLYYGEGVTEEQANAAGDKITSLLPGVEVTVVHGGQPVYAFMISAE